MSRLIGLVLGPEAPSRIPPVKIVLKILSMLRKLHWKYGDCQEKLCLVQHINLSLSSLAVTVKG